VVLLKIQILWDMILSLGMCCLTFKRIVVPSSSGLSSLLGQHPVSEDFNLQGIINWILWRQV
jgi:hypothetical protein